MRHLVTAALVLAGAAAPADTLRHVYLADAAGARTEIARLTIAEAGGYTVEMAEAPFADHFLSMRPFRCLEGPDRLWCHVPYPYEIARDISADLTDLEYDFLFLWKPAGAYGIDMWNGVYYRLAAEGERLVGTLHEVDMNLLAAPPAPGELRPLGPADLTPGDPDSHWLPRLVID